MKRIVLLRHGESLWNKENRFTGWTDVDLSDKGIAEACKAGDMLKEAGFSFEAAYTSYLKRAVKTLNCVLDRLNEDWIPVEKSWRLNEKHYGILQGLNKRETADKYGEEQVHIWRRSYGVSPEPVKEDDPRYPGNDSKILLREVKGRYLGYFGSFTWAGAAVKRLAEFAEKSKFELVGDPVEMKQAMKDLTYTQCENLARAMADRLKKDR